MKTEKYKHLTPEQRYTIDSGLKKGMTRREIAELIGVSAATVTREIQRNANKRGRYTHRHAQVLADERKERVRRNRAVPQPVWRVVEEKLRMEWSPEQVAGWLKRERGISLSHETIYARIRRDRQQGGDLYTHCRHRMKRRGRAARGGPAKIPGRVSIHDRPRGADGSTFGDFEMDTIISARSRAVILTLVERYTGLILMARVAEGKAARAVARTAVLLLAPYKGKIRSITTDNGTEFRDHQYITERLGARVYFADPYASWQKGTIEYSNKLIRQYVRKK